MTTSTFLEISIGTAPNDGTGDPIRDAFDKVNKNFATLFTSTSLVIASGIDLVDLRDTPKTYSLTVPPVDGVVVLTNDNVGTYTNKYFYGDNDIRVTKTGTNVVISHLYTATTASIANTLVLRDSVGNISGGGFAGSVGFIGSIGFTGSQGFSGSNGFTGSQGVGFTGSLGFAGSIGYTGSVGPIGPGGGPPGFDGSSGFTGSVGYIGSLGYTGSTGGSGTIASSTASYVAVYSGATSVTGYSNFTYNTGDGKVTAVDFIASSDKNLKTVVGEISNALASLEHIHGVKYKWNKNAEAIGIYSDKVHLGVMAQDVAKVYPEIVDTHNGYLAVNYDKLVPVLIEATKEQHSLILQQQEQINRLERLIMERP